jgi:biopolymer transport protein ExbD
MTPMVDVTFLLLVFFMVTASFAVQRSFEFPSHDEGQSQTQIDLAEVALVTLTIDEFNTYRVSTPDWEEEVASEFDLHVALRSALQQQEDSNRPVALLVRANGEALHQNVVTVLDAGMAVGLSDVRLETIEGE